MSIVWGDTCLGPTGIPRPIAHGPEHQVKALGVHDSALLAQVELQEVVDFFTKPKLFRNSGARIPKGVLLCGPPGALPNAVSCVVPSWAQRFDLRVYRLHQATEPVQAITLGLNFLLAAQ